MFGSGISVYAREGLTSGSFESSVLGYYRDMCFGSHCLERGKVFLWIFIVCVYLTNIRGRMLGILCI